MPRPTRPTQQKATQRRRARQRQKTVSFLRQVEPVLRAVTVRLPALPRPALPRLQGHWLLGSGWHAGKGLTLLLLVGLTLTLNWIFTDPRFFVAPDQIHFDNLSYLTPEELLPQIEVEDWSIFWLNGSELSRQVTRHPYVRSATVEIGFPASVRFHIVEAEPVALWLTDVGEMWVLDDGTALLNRGERPGLVTIVDGPQAAREIGGGRQLALNPAILQSALALARTIPGLERFRYHLGPGLSFAMPNNQTVVYWGDGLHLEEKLINLTTIQLSLRQKKLTAQQIDVRFPNKPYFR